jgi:hypothetical protein
MIALVTTYFLIFYILVPGVLFRFLTSWFVPLKLFERTRTQEATFAVAVALLPFAIALFGVWNLPVMRHLPFPIAEGTAAERTQDYQRVTSILTASDASRLLINTPSAAPSSIQLNDANWRSLNQVIRRQARFLTWYFVLIALEGICFGLLAMRYGDWRDQAQNRAQQQAQHGAQHGAKRYRIRLWLIRTFILPNISEWHLLLTSFNWPRREDVDVSIDILQNDGILYQGRVADYFLDPSGKLTGILLEHVSRFDREAYHEAQKSTAQQQPISSAAFWRSIPGSRFYIGQSSILNLNVRFVARDQTLISLAETILDAEDANSYEVTVESEEETANSQHPDIYA